MSQTEYARQLRPLLSAEAFEADPKKLIILGLNIGIFLAGILTARHLSTWPPAALPLFLPIALLMANSVAVFSFSCHYLMHNSVIKQSPRLVYWVSLVGFALW